ncbi:MAG: hypothetical protein OEZ22_00455 [Spirochaetia bacterium]|nr:hypothetical protein [Spirochaetia bacterium]
MEEDKNSDNKSHNDKAEKIKNTGKKVWDKSKESIKHLSENIHESLEEDTNENLYASLSYFPVLGPLIVFIFKKNQKISKYHAENAMYLQGFFFLIWFSVWLLENIPLISHLLSAILFIPHITNAILYVNTAGYLTFSFMGVYYSSKGQKWSVPFLYDFCDKKFKKNKKSKNN